MQKVAILTDSTCDLPVELQRRYKIEILNFTLNLDGRTYTERLDFTPQQYYKMLRAVRTAPTTNPLPADVYLDAFKRYADNGYTDLIVVTLASTVSETNNNAHLALTRFYAQRADSRLRLHVLDSKLMTMGLGYPICVAAAMLEQQTDANQVVAYLEDCFSRIQIAFAAYTFKFLKLSGRISGFGAFTGDLFRLRPIMSYIDGISKAESSAQGDKQVIPAMCEYARPLLDRSQPYLVGTTMSEHGQRLIDECTRSFGYPPQMVFDLGATLATHLGPEGDVIVFFGNKRRR